MSTDEYVSSWGPEPLEPRRDDYSPRLGGDGLYHVPALGDGNEAFFRSEDNAKRAGNLAYGEALRYYNEWHFKKDLETKPTPGQEKAEAMRTGKQQALREGISEAEWDQFPEIRANYVAPTKSGAELWEEYKRGRGNTGRLDDPDKN
ncbi:hypothetical protein SAMN04487916_11753 [Arthrobacter sp. ov407]|uniref:hypothetical protein n=1 Tax=Arthrobacter sp. ov407 TaxID=1761748 RepID=UPI00088DD812|nr:hypothetical protein [Arthrobacter sp. ov407]SDL90285.1 hypothetical protein SAMN04487916_11753 [Arthrobacter sp. ov407]